MDYEQYEAKKEQETKQGQSTEKVSEFPKSYQKDVDDKLQFDVEVVCGEGIAAKGVPKATASVESLNLQRMNQYFMGECSNVQMETNDNYRDVDGKIVTVTTYIDDQASELWVADKEGAYVRSPLTTYIDNSFLDFFFHFLSGL